MTLRRSASRIVVLLAALGCRSLPDAPTEPEATAAARAQAPLLARMARDVDEALAAVERARGCEGSACPCADAAEALLPRCRGVLAERRAREREVVERFQRATVPAWTRDTPLLGAEVTVLIDRGATKLLGEAAPARPGRRAGAVRAPRGELAAASWQSGIGRGLFQTSWTRGAERYGDGEYRRGIELHWTRVRGTSRAWITAWLLVDGWRRPAAWPVR